MTYAKIQREVVNQDQDKKKIKIFVTFTQIDFIWMN